MATFFTQNNETTSGAAGTRCATKTPLREGLLYVIPDHIANPRGVVETTVRVCTPNHHLRRGRLHTHPLAAVSGSTKQRVRGSNSSESP
jgi:hypothetical protein